MAHHTNLHVKEDPCSSIVVVVLLLGNPFLNMGVGVVSLHTPQVPSIHHPFPSPSRANAPPTNNRASFEANKTEGIQGQPTKPAAASWSTRPFLREKIAAWNRTSAGSKIFGTIDSPTAARRVQLQGLFTRDLHEPGPVGPRAVDPVSAADMRPGKGLVKPPWSTFTPNLWSQFQPHSWESASCRGGDQAAARVSRRYRAGWRRAAGKGRAHRVVVVMEGSKTLLTTTPPTWHRVAWHGVASHGGREDGHVPVHAADGHRD